MRYPKGSTVVFNPRRLFEYGPIYGITRADVFTVVHIERRDPRRRVLYLASDSRPDWLPVYPSHVVLAKKAQRRKVRRTTDISP